MFKSSLLLLTIFLASCGGGGDSVVAPPISPLPAPTTLVKSVQIQLPNAAGYWGRSLQASVEIKDAAGLVLTGKSTVWASSSPNIATVDSNGLVQLITPGVTQITATTEGVSSNSLVATVKGFQTESLSVYQKDNCALSDTADEIRCWGDGYPISQNSPPLKLEYPSPVKINLGAIPTGSLFAQVAPSFGFSCALTKLSAVFCWAGANSPTRPAEVAMLGTGSRLPIGDPAPVLAGEIPAGATVKKIKPGFQSACALVSDGEIYCWGDSNDIGPLANPVPSLIDVHSAPARIARGARALDDKVIDFALGNNRICLLSESGRVYCGPTSKAASTSAVLLPQGAVPINVKLVSITVDGQSGDFFGAMGDDGWFYTFGIGAGARFGDGSNLFVNNNNDIKRLARGAIPDGAKIVQGTMGSNAGSNCVLVNNGKAYCWNRGYFGSLGDGDLTDHTVSLPTEVKQGEIPTGVQIANVKCGAFHCTVIGSDRRAYAWGYNESAATGRTSTSSGLTSTSVASPRLINTPE
jgi:Bacterial Ig-like domain (group 2)/Regulator of chromosome condensation (RCC1) repeat